MWIRYVSMLMLWVCFCTSPPVVLAQEAVGLYLYRTDVQQGDLSGFNVGKTLVLELQSTRPRLLAASLSQTSIRVLAIGQDMVRVGVGPAEIFAGAPEERHASPSWIVDYDEPVFDQITNTLWQDGEPDIQAILRQAHQMIPQKNYRNGFLIASQVARMGEGDCTEHAVLTTALARASGYAARIVFGFFLAIRDGELQALGHAWSEIYDGERWHIADATDDTGMSGLTAGYYLPWKTLSNEGPGYNFEMFEFAELRPTRVIVTNEPARFR